MGGPTSQIRFSEAQKLLNYGFANYYSKKLANKDENYSQIVVNKGTREKVNLKYEGNCGILLKKGEEKNIDQIVDIPESISAPLKKGEVVGSITYTANDEVVGAVNLVAEEDVDKLNLGNMMKLTYDSWFNLLRNIK